MCLADSRSLTNFEKNDVVLPFKVLEEIDGHKKRQDAVGANAREVIRFLDSLREEKPLSAGVKLGKDLGTLKVIHPQQFKDLTLNTEVADNEIIETAILVKKLNPTKKVILITRDINMRVKCDSLAVPCEDYRHEHVIESSDKLFSGIRKVSVPESFIEEIYEGGEVFYEPKDKEKFFPNEFLYFVSEVDDKKAAFARFISKDKPLVRINDKEVLYGKMKSRNKEQSMAINLLLDRSVKVLTLVGKAGSGKTGLSIAAALQLQEKFPDEYRKILISRPIVPVGNDIGFLPGPQPLDAKVLTPTGWTTMGKVAPGTKVISRDGKPTEVLEIFPKGIKKIYKITTFDDQVTECCEDHLWFTKTFENKKRQTTGSVKTTKEIMNSLYVSKTFKGEIRSIPNHYLPRVEPVEYEKKELPIPAYSLGVLLGDGSITDAISFTNVDKDIIDRTTEELATIGCTVTGNDKNIAYAISNTDGPKNNKTAQRIKLTNLENGSAKEFYSIGQALEEIDINRSTLHQRCLRQATVENVKYEFLEPDHRWQNILKEKLYQLDILGDMAYTKKIPELYKYSSIEDRFNLLRGLMDTDGTVKKNGEAMFCTTSTQLATDIRELVFSLGGKCNIRMRNRVGESREHKGRQITKRVPSYEFTISMPPGSKNIFHCKRKADRFESRKESYMHHCAIKSIEECGEKEVMCILVANPEHTYVTDDFIVTHNTKEEKLSPWTAPIYDNLEFLLDNGKKGGASKKTLEYFFEQGIIEVEAMAYIRGRSIANAIIIVDEAQNLSKHEVKTILTRVGEGSKIIFTGDIEQIDSPYLDDKNNGLTHLVEKFKDFRFSGHVTLRKGERSEVATAASQVL